MFYFLKMLENAKNGIFNIFNIRTIAIQSSPFGFVSKSQMMIYALKVSSCFKMAAVTSVCVSYVVICSGPSSYFTFRLFPLLILLQIGCFLYWIQSVYPIFI